MELEQLLDSFVESIKPSPEWSARAKTVTERVYNTLKQYSSVHMMRFEQVGGMAKGTSTCLKADVDVVVYFDDENRKLTRKEVRFAVLFKTFIFSFFGVSNR